jgi:hypothetical protein
VIAYYFRFVIVGWVLYFSVFRGLFAIVYDDPLRFWMTHVYRICANSCVYCIYVYRRMHTFEFIALQVGIGPPNL